MSTVHGHALEKRCPLYCQESVLVQKKYDEIMYRCTFEYHDNMISRLIKSNISQGRKVAGKQNTVIL